MEQREKRVIKGIMEQRVNEEKQDIQEVMDRMVNQDRKVNED